MSQALPAERLLAIIGAQNEIAATALDLDAVVAMVLERAQAMTRADAAVVEMRLDASLGGRCVSDGQTLHCPDARLDDRVDGEACARVGAVSLICVPLQRAGVVVGVLEAHHRRPEAFGRADVETLDLLSGVIEARMAHAEAVHARDHDSHLDDLTGLPNGRALEERLRIELSRLGRHGGKLALCLGDLDSFKEFNDAHGHAAGDGVLQAVAVNLSRLRDEDTAYRLGGDEFALILIETSETGARAALARIVKGLRRDSDCRGVAVSMGVAGSQPNDDPASIMARAEAALSQAKEASRARNMRARGRFLAGRLRGPRPAPSVPAAESSVHR